MGGICWEGRLLLRVKGDLGEVFVGEIGICWELGFDLFTFLKK